jgi:alpha-tubulin suppressor-like RCC1 family protein
LLKSDGTVWATGDNSEGQLGDGSNTQRNNPVQVSDSSGNAFANVAAIAAGYDHTIFLKADGTVWATGDNSEGQLGDGSTVSKSNPVQVSDSSGNAIANVAAIAAGVYHTIFLKADGTVWATGNNSEGQLGDGSTVNKSNPVQVSDSSGNAFANVAAIAAGFIIPYF